MNPLEVMDMPVGLIQDMEWAIREEKRQRDRAARIAKAQGSF